MYALREALSPLLILVWFPVLLLSPDSLQPSFPMILAIVAAMTLTGWSMIFRQWHLRRDAEAYLRYDYDAWLRGPGARPAEPVFLTWTCRVFRHRHPVHDAGTA